MLTRSKSRKLIKPPKELQVSLEKFDFRSLQIEEESQEITMASKEKDSTSISVQYEEYDLFKHQETSTNINNDSYLAAAAGSAITVADAVGEAIKSIRIPQTINIKPFNGTSKEDPIDWIERYESMAVSADWTKDQRVSKVINYLEENAASWFMNSVYDKNLTWSEFKNRFLQTFKPPNEKELALMKLSSRYQKLDEDIMNYFHDINRLCRRVDENMPEEMKIYYLKNNLKPTLLEKVYHLDFKTCDQLYRKILKLEQGSFLANSRQRWTGSLITAPEKQPQNSIPVKTEDIRKIVADELSKAMSNLKKPTETSSNIKSKNNRPNSSNVTCFYCKKQGHFIKDCFKRKRENPPNRVQTNAMMQPYQPQMLTSFQPMNYYTTVPQPGPQQPNQMYQSQPALSLYPPHYPINIGPPSTSRQQYAIEQSNDVQEQGNDNRQP